MIQELQNPEVERIILSAIITSPRAARKISDLVKEEYFFSDTHRLIFKTVVELLDAGKSIDYQVVAHNIEEKGVRGIGEVVMNLNMTSIPRTTPMRSYIEILQDNWQWRRQVEISQKIEKMVRERKRPDDIYAWTDKENQSVLIGTVDYTMFGDKVVEATKRIEDLMKLQRSSASGIVGIPSGLHELDTLTAGFTSPELIIIAGRPAMGKSALKKTIEANASLDKVVLGFALEMSEEQEEDRLIAQIAGVDGFRISTGRLSNDDFGRIVEAQPELEKFKLIIDDTPAISISELKARARAVAIEHDLGMITIDYLQLMTGDKGGNREQEVSGISRQLKELAKELGVPIIALAQLSRAVETRGGDKKPILSDLRESGSLEQDSDTVLFLYRPEYYGLTTYENGISTEGIAEVIIAKQRKGPSGTEAKVGFKKEWMKFYDLTENDVRRYDDTLPYKD